MDETITAAAIQMNARLGDVAGNLERAERLVREAFRRGAQWVVLPEFFTSPVGYHFALRHVALPPDGGDPAADQPGARVWRRGRRLVPHGEGADATNRSCWPDLTACSDSTTRINRRCGRTPTTSAPR